MKKWIKITLVVVGLLAFAAVVWFALPFIAFGGFAPFESIWVRLGIIGFVWLLVGGIYLFRFLRARRQAKALEKGMLAGGGEDSDSKVLTERMSEALKTLKASSGKSNYLYTLPWYIIIGPPGAGKTTALIKSGLKFPLADAQGGVSAIAGSGGTRYCDWWFTDEAVLVDTAGRYTTQDSDAEADKRSWLGFLQMLKRNRPKQPINGVIVAISLKDVMTMDAAELAAHSAAIRKRLLEVHHELKIDFPVYALFTKADLISGFSEYFGNFTESRRRKVWGATFQTEDRRKNMIGAVPAEFDALVKRLTEELPDRLQEEPDQISRIAIFGFPAQFAMLKDHVYDFLRQIFEPNRYQVNANLRGFYFSSGTQEGTPIDQVLGAMGRSFGGDSPLGNLSGLGKSYFLHDLITRVIFSETGWVSMDAAAVRRSAFFRYGAISLLGLVTVLLLGAWGWSYANNEQLIDQTQKFVSDYRVEAADELNRAVISDTDVMSVLPALDMLRDNPVGYAHRDDGTPIQEGFGLSQRARLNASSEAAYRQGLERMFRSRLILRLEAQMQGLMNDPPSVYQALKTYMMVGGVAPKVDADFVVAWMKQDWEDQYPGPQNSSARNDLESHLRAMLALDVGRRPSFELNGLLIDSAQRTLTRLSIAEQAYGYMKSLSPGMPLEDFNVAARSGPESQAVFETIDGSDFGALTVPAMFTYRGFHEFFLPQLSVVAEELINEQWVRGELGKDMASEEQLSQLGPKLLAFYSADFAKTWNDVLDNIRLKALPGEKPDFIPLSILGNQTSSPLRALVKAVVDETQLTREPADAAAAGGDVSQSAAEAQDYIEQRLKARTYGLQRIGIELALKKASGRPGETSTGAGVPGANIEAQFQDYAALLQGSPAAIDLLVDGFNEVYKNKFLAAHNPSQAQQAENAAQLNVSNLSLSSSRFPAALRRIIAGGVDDLEGDAAGSSIAQLNQALASEVTGICQKFTADLYPFASNSKRDLPMADFSRLFAPNGVMDRFFAERLAPLADLTTDPWTWKQDSALGRDLSNSALREFQRAADIRDAFFPPGSPTPQVTLTIMQTSLNPAAEAALLDINGTVIQTQQLGNLPQTIQWPGSGGGAVTLSLSPEMPGRESTVTVPGPWALMRVLALNTVSRRGDTLRVTIMLGGRDVSYSIQVGTVLNPFFLPALSEFSCPTGF